MSDVSFRPCGLITLTTDFGTRDAYVGAVKGVILSVDASLALHDIAHDVVPQDVAGGARVLRGACPYFPRGTVHVAVVDPGVGTERAPLVALAGGHAFVAPDNGILNEVVTALGGLDRAHRIERAGRLAAVLPSRSSSTFHGRDIFAPVAAALACGRISIDEIGPVHPRLDSRPIGAVERIESALVGLVTHHDHFGNAITNVRAADLEDLAAGTRRVRLPGGTSVPLARTYADAAPGEPVALLGSEGFLEIAVRDGSAHQQLGLDAGASIRIESVR